MEIRREIIEPTQRRCKETEKIFAATGILDEDRDEKKNIKKRFVKYGVFINRCWAAIEFISFV